MACAFAFLPAAHAQETVNNASLSGTVTDPSTAVVTDAQVSARRIETNVTVKSVTDNSGRFRFPISGGGALRSQSK